MSSLLDHHIKEDRFEFDVRNKLNSILELVRRIDAVNAVEHQKTRSMIVNKPQSDDSDPNRRPDPVAVITAEVELLSVSEEEELKLQKNVKEEIIRYIAYPEMTFRYERILEAYPTTFEWVFRDPTADQLPWNSFSDWLETGDGVYWINGKAGSGKSTLMKHIFDSQRTQNYLATWASTSGTDDSRPLCFATFFFWNSGTPEQKSQMGLIRSLLYQVLRTCPNLIPVILPDAWAMTYSALIHHTSYHMAELLTQKRLMVAFRALIHQTRIPLKLCFLVDGLDEFEGSESSHQEMADLFKEITKVHNVKVCLSSRPWVVFSDSFKGCPNLRLQDLTRLDITRYVNGKFGKSQAFCTLKSQEPEAAHELTTEIIEKADGVFLWVQIVVSSLLRGIQNRDDMEILHQRLRCMPKELEPLYRHLLTLIEPVYLSWASKTFQIARAYRDNFSGMTSPPGYPIYYADVEDKDFTISTLRLAVTENISMDIRPEHVGIVEQVSPTISYQLTEESLASGCEKTKVQLTARCAGLLEVPEFERHGHRATIEYLHRTARDFIEKEQNWQDLRRHTSGTTFHPAISILRASVLRLGIRCSFQDTTSQGVRYLAYCVLLQAYRVDLLLQQRNETANNILEDMVRIMTTWDAIRKLDRKYAEECKTGHWTSRLIGDIDVPEDWKVTALAVVYGLTSYVSIKLREEVSARLVSRLLYCLFPLTKWDDRFYVPKARPDMVSLLLSHRANPDLIFGRDLNYSSARVNSYQWYNSDSTIGKLFGQAPQKRKAVEESILVIEGSGHQSKKTR
jgi:hypothetical protein